MESNAKATWIWYPGDFEVWLGNRFNNRRTERGAMFPPFWKQDSHWPTVEFTQPVLLDRAERINIATEGLFNFSIDGTLQPPGCLTVPAGQHRLSFKVWNQASPPALMVWGDTIRTDATWQTTYEDKIWLDENGVAHGSGIYVPVGSWCFDDPQVPPSRFQLERTEQAPVSKEEIGPRAALFDFGRETFGYLKLAMLTGTVHMYYGESREEALDKQHCETLDVLHSDGSQGFTLAGAKAFRYVYIEKDGTADFDALEMEQEYAPFSPERSGTFRCNDDELNRIWQTAAYTLELTTREFFCDGIKRDRWTWSGDAIQSYLMNYYLHFDQECVKRTIRQLRGKDPVTAHVNTIMDYTFYWFVSIGHYYLYTGDVAFLREMWPKMQTLMDYVLGRLNEQQMAEGQADDWLFVDWVDFPMHKCGTLCFEQLLLWKALQVMAQCARLLSRSVCCDSVATNGTPCDTIATNGTPCDTIATNGTPCGTIATNGTDYAALATALREKVKGTFWSTDRHVFLHAIEDGQLNDQVTKFPNMFAILYDFASKEEREQILKHVLLNPDVPPITTPYMRFYELEALCMMGLHDHVLPQLKAYWGGMLREGATTFWEKYNPEEHGSQHLAMYGRPYGKSLCHSWGASPLYIMGRYFLGVSPTKPGYEAYEVRPVLGGLEWMEGEVPTPFGKIRVKMNRHEVTVFSDGGKGILVVGNQQTDIPANKEITLNL